MNIDTEILYFSFSNSSILSNSITYFHLFVFLCALVVFIVTTVVMATRKFEALIRYEKRRIHKSLEYREEVLNQDRYQWHKHEEDQNQREKMLSKKEDDLEKKSLVINRNYQFYNPEKIKKIQEHIQKQQQSIQEKQDQLDKWEVEQSCKQYDLDDQREEIKSREEQYYFDLREFSKQKEKNNRCKNNAIHAMLRHKKKNESVQ